MPKSNKEQALFLSERQSLISDQVFEAIVQH
jgi:hypothetical protein